MVADVEQQVSRLRQAGDWYLQAVDAIPADGWAKPSLCEGWTAANVVAHVTTGDQLFRGLLLDALGKDRSGLDLPIDFADRQRRFQVLSTWEPAKLKDAAHRESEQTVTAITDALKEAPDLILTLAFGKTPLPVVRSLRVNEYVIHAHDLMPAVGRSIPAPEWFIDRGLPDSLNMMNRLHQRSTHKGKSASFHLHRTDGEGEWVIRAEGGQVVTEAVHARADVAMRGSAEGLYWVVMGRGKPEDHGIEVHGDPVLAAAFKEWFPGP
jgi:uncharacterized protein (TIGR03083 family)